MPWGQSSPSVYETGRLVTLAPWLTGHVRRLEFILAMQRPDGGWGAPGGHGLVPTLSATDAVLAVLTSPDGDSAVRAAADRALRMLFDWLPRLAPAAVPDMPGIDLITTSLILSINRRLADSADRVPGWINGGRLRPPSGSNGERLALAQAALEAGRVLPQKLLHALEVFGEPARGAATVRPGPTGVIGASPAATARWLDDAGRLDPAHPARRFLEAAVRQHHGPVPCGLPITVFERAWVLAGLARAGIDATVPPDLLDSLRPALEPGGTAAGDGLPPDADTTAGAVYALGLQGAPFHPDALWPFELDTHFCTWQGEDGFSVTTNAHVLEAFGLYVVRSPEATVRHAAVTAKLSRLLRDRQLDDGGWDDRWHASPYYATMCCALALDRFGGPDAASAVRAAVRWVVGTQRADGSWGRWGGTAEETAYALQILLLTRPAGDEHAVEAAVRGHAYLGCAADEPDGACLWHDKDLYRPTAIVDAAVLAALHLARANPAIASRLPAVNELEG
jgi:halimadienyl-diphosphate synthase